MSLPSLSNMLIGNQYIGIEHYTLDNEDSLAFLLIEKRKGELHIAAKGHNINVAELPKDFNKNLPFYLIINTSQVIQKEVEGIEPNNEKLIHKAFPNLAWSDFYYEIWRLKTKSLVAVSRKSYVDALVSEYQKQGVSIAGIGLGICAVAGIMPYTSNVELETNTQIICSEETNPIVAAKNKNTSTDYDLNGLTVQNYHILCFAGMLRLLMGNDSVAGNIRDLNNKLLASYNQRSFFSKGIKIMVGSLLLILLLNFFAFNFYYKKAEETNNTIVVNQSSLDQINALKSRIQLKEAKVKDYLDLSTSKSSQIINEITSIVPASVLLNELAYNPLEKKIKAEEPIAVSEKMMLISGTTINNEAFTNWVENIEHITKVKQVTIANFGKDETNATVFTIKIVLK